MNELENAGCKDIAPLSAQKIAAQKLHREMGERCRGIALKYVYLLKGQFLLL